MFPGKRSIPTLRTISLTAFVSLAILQPPALFAQRSVGTGFSYQGQLKDGGIPADGSYDLRFSMFDALQGGNQWRAQVCVDNVNVVDGLFTVQIDFGEGIFDNGRAPGIRGQLHAIVLDNDAHNDDDIIVKQFTTKIHVDGGHGGDESGQPDRPFSAVGEALGIAWDGAIIHIRGRAYPENFMLSKRVRMSTWDGTARIGD